MVLLVLIRELRYWHHGDDRIDSCGGDNQTADSRPN